jgi:hypothetical protein
MASQGDSDMLPSGGGFRRPDDFKIPATPEVSRGAGVADLQAQVARQYLMIQTLCRILIAKGVLSEDELNEWMNYVDGLDGVVDGKLRESRLPRECSACRRMNPPRAVKCQYCGHEFPAAFLEPEPKANP